MKKLLILGLIVMTTGCSSHAVDRDTQIKECTAKGVRYFKEIGSFPTLSNGRDATKEAKARCTRQPVTAFGS